ncbi:MAG: NEW3 domain-containing protein, partial [Thermoguttaceae bacterium]|nr:NEW3 domain-containing protein [Thermoguttaceae bacterium]
MRIVVLVWLTLGIGVATLPAGAAEPVALRVGSFTLAPAHTPHAVVTVKNLTAATYEGALRVRGPAGWNIVPSEQKVSLPPGQSKRVVFTVQRGTIVESNSYPLEVTAEGAGASVVHRQHV